MNTIFVIVIGISGLIYCSYFGYWSWVKPDKLNEKIHKFRKRTKFLNFFPSSINELAVDFQKRPLFLWLYRIGSIIMFIFFSFFIILYFLDLSSL